MPDVRPSADARKPWSDATDRRRPQPPGFAAAVIAAAIAGCGKSAPPVKALRRIFASAEEVELNFAAAPSCWRQESNRRSAPAGSAEGEAPQAAAWFGVNILRQESWWPRKVISTSSARRLSKAFGHPRRRMIEWAAAGEAGTVFVTMRTRYLAPGKIRPIIVQYCKRE